MISEQTNAYLHDLRESYRVGSSVLATCDLLTLVLGTQASPHARELVDGLLAEYGGLLGIARLRLPELCGVDGVGLAKAVQLRAIFELANRLAHETVQERPVIHSAADVAGLLMTEMVALEQEQLRAILLDTRNRVQAVHTVYQGSLNSIPIRPADVFREPVRRGSAAIIVAHNHPSGDCSPSPEDVAVSRTLVETGKMLDIPLMDHIIIGHARFVSLRERGLIGFEIDQ